MDFDFKPVQPKIPAKSVTQPTQTPVVQTAKAAAQPDTDTQLMLDAAKTEQARAIARMVDSQSSTSRNEIEPDVIELDNTDNAKSPKKPKRHLRKLALHWPPKRKEVAVIAVIAVFCGLGGVALITNHKEKPVAASQPAKKATVAAVPTTVPSTLSGLPVKPEVNKQVVTGVMVENSQQARPQSGLSQAGVVFEAIAEGGITRFMALYQDTAPENVGPIRSARPYYAQWAMGFDAGYAHVGGSPEALASIKAWGMRDLDQFYNAGAYHRISERAAPHNVYTGIGTLNQLEAGKGYTTSTYTGFSRKGEQPAKSITAKAINMSISGPLYDVHYDYDPAGNSYKRSEGGAPHMDANTNAQLSPKVVIGLVSQYSLAADGYHSAYNVIGTGQAYIFQDGAVTVAQWSKADNKSQLAFKDAKGKAIKLNPGQTWITAVNSAGSVSYTSR